MSVHERNIVEQIMFKGKKTVTTPANNSLSKASR